MKSVTLPPSRGMGHAVAVVGLHGRFPGAQDVHTFWRNLRDGIDPITEVPAQRWRHQDIFGEPDGTEERTYAITGGFAPHVDRFDCRFFNITPREAESMDPQQRLFLQTSWAAFEDGGFAPSKLAGRPVGVFVGVGHADYPALMRRDRAPFDVFRGTGIVPTAIANRVSFALDLRGPSEAIDTACSGSLVAMHRATQALASGECELAIAGGVNLLLGPELFIAFAKAGMLSRTGRCRPFDRGGDGYVRGEGVAAVVLKPLQAAEEDGDFIYGVIRGSAENHGGRAHSFTAPSVGAQAEVVSRAWSRAGVSMWDACLIETHGTGTRLGDPIEIKGLVKALGPDSPLGAPRAAPSIALGALKSHIGHLEAAAGVAGVMKALLAMQHQLIPPNLHFKALNAEIDLSATPFQIPSRPIDLTTHAGRKPLTAGVSSFGFGGSNAHIVLEAYRPDVEDAEEDGAPQLILISARDEIALLGRVRQLADYVQQCGDASQGSGALDAIVGEALRLGAPASACGPIRLAALNLDIEDFSRALAEIGTHLGRRVALGEIRDCVTVAELADRLERLVGMAPDAVVGSNCLLARVSLPDDVLRRTPLAAISCALLHGRDAMEERLALVAESKEVLRLKLEAFLAAPHAKNAGWHRGSVRRGAAAGVPRPNAPVGRPLADDLVGWARYWATTPRAEIAWEDLNLGRRPRKVPLPAYPFQLARIWYQTGATPSVTVLTRGVSQPIEIPNNGTVFDRPKASNEMAASAITALCTLASHLGARSGGRPVRLSGIEFGPPVAVSATALSIRESSESGGLVQCVSARNGMPHVLVQGRAAFGGKLPSERVPILARKARTIGQAEFCTFARECGNSIDDISGCLDEMWASNDAIHFKIGQSTAAEPGSLLRSVLRMVIAAAASLAREPSSRQLLPVRVTELALDTAALQRPLTLVVRTEPGRGGAQAYGVGSESLRPVVALRGLELRLASGGGTAVRDLSGALAGSEVSVP